MPVSVADLANLRDIGGHARGAISVSPDGRWVAFQLQTPKVSEETYALAWMAVSGESGSAAQRIARGGDLMLNPDLAARTNGNRPETRAQWSPDSEAFAYLLRRRGRTHIWLSKPIGKGQTRLTAGTGDVIDFQWASDGSKLYFRKGLDKTQAMAGLVEEGARGFLFDERFDVKVTQHPFQRVCSFEERQINAVALTRACEPALWVYDFKNRSERPATEEIGYEHQRQGSPPPAAISDRSPQKLRQWQAFDQYAWLENEEPETYAGNYAPLTLYALIEGKIHRCAAEPCRGYNLRGHQDLWWRQDGQEIIFLRRDGASHSKTGLYAWAPAADKLRRIFQSDDWLSDCAPADDRLVCLYESWTKPRSIVSVSLKDGAVTVLYDPNPIFAGRRFSTIEKLEWEDAYGNASHGHLVYPIDYEAGRAYPLVIITYQSRGFLRGGVGDEYPIHPLAAEGFFVLSHEMPFDLELVARAKQPNGPLYEDLYIRRSVLSSQKKIVRNLVNRGLIDPERVAITGLSEGASQTQYGLTHSAIFTVGIASGVFFSPGSYYVMNEKSREFWRLLLNGSPDDVNSSWRELSMGLNADLVHAPLSDKELLGTIENFARLQDALKAVEMYVFPDEHHIKWRPDHRLAIYRRNVQWLKFWLQGEEVDDPLDPQQYSRWRKMRDEQCVQLMGDDAPWYCKDGEVNLTAH